jgi:hypothetical protein
VLIDPWVNVDFGDGCEVTVNTNTSWANFAFNGIVVEITDPDAPPIANVTLTDSTTGDFDASQVTFDATRIALNYSGMLAAGYVKLAIEYGVASTCAADVDGSGDVGFGDLLAVLSSWGACPGCPEDIDGDDNANFSDVLAVLSAWGSCD